MVEALNLARFTKELDGCMKKDSCLYEEVKPLTSRSRLNYKYWGLGNIK